MMESWLSTLFWLAALAVAYTYVLFPLVVVLRGWLCPRPFDRAEITPPISVLIAARNEETSIGARLENLLAANYPMDRLEVIVASDGSTDATERIARRFTSRGVRVLHRFGRGWRRQGACRRSPR